MPHSQLLAAVKVKLNLGGSMLQRQIQPKIQIFYHFRQSIAFVLNTAIFSTLFIRLAKTEAIANHMAHHMRE